MPFLPFNQCQSTEGYLHCELASCGAVYCNRSRLWVCGSACGCVCLWVCYHDNSKLRASIFTKLDLKVKVVTFFWPTKSWQSHASEKGVCGGANFFGSALLQPARSVCISTSAFFILCRKAVLSSVDSGWGTGPPKNFEWTGHQYRRSLP